MKNINKKPVQLLLAASIAVLLSACDTSSSSGPDSGAASSGTATTLVATDFSFPAVDAATDAVAAPTGQTPAFSARRTLSKGAGNTVEFGDPVVLDYQMYSWSTGALVESSDTLDHPITVRAGVGEGIPLYLSQSLLGRNIGDKIQIVFERGMEDLPDYLDKNDAYIVVVKLI